MSIKCLPRGFLDDVSQGSLKNTRGSLREGSAVTLIGINSMTGSFNSVQFNSMTGS